MSRRVVVLTRGGPFLEGLLAAFEARGVRPHALMLYQTRPLAEWRALPPAKRLPALPLVPLRWLRRRMKLRLAPEQRRRAGRVIVTGGLNGRRMLRDLRRLAPDVLVLHRCHVVSPEVLAIPREGTACVHPGLLPWVRGSAPVPNSLLRGVPIGCTAFRVDPGIDTGPVLERRLLPLTGRETLAELGAAIDALWDAMAAGLVSEAATAPLPPGEAQTERFPLGRRLRDPALEARFLEAYARGDALALYERWRDPDAASPHAPRVPPGFAPVPVDPPPT